MKSVRSSKLFQVFVLAIGVLGASASSAHAQSATGKFTLSHETHWGSVVLSPGVYSFSLQSPSLPAPLMVGKTGGSQIAIVLPQVVATERPTSGSSLVLNRNESGASFVSALYLGDLGVSLHFAAPRSQASAPETAKLSPIADSAPGK
jgi:hypothetical protein